MLAALQSWWSSTWPQLIALLVALVAAWIAYRLQRGEEGEGVLRHWSQSLSCREYPRGVWTAGYSARWWGEPRDWHTVVYKLSTVATDNAIQVGPSLFINQDRWRPGGGVKAGRQVLPVAPS